MPGGVLGTPAYMAPEQIESNHWGAAEITPAADVFSFGVVAWTLLMGSIRRD